GTDAQPYFRIFNPETQIKKWDKEGQFLDEWVPERHEANYPDPIVEYKEARNRAIITYKQALSPKT
ncbi:MAG: FAD-binding domain-containing protein, partial [Cytophagales bacterium]|nr:FAD-binding domain-containing protein [Cytophagales bacterium]